jgi:uncharacterized membrane protein YdbT with pleckstrin-like domain
MAKDLLPGENLVMLDHPHWIVVVKSVVAPVLLVIVVVIADLTILGPGALYVAKLRTILTLAVVALALLWLIVVWIRWQAISYTLTDQRIKIESGVFGRQTKTIPIDRIQDCSTKQSLVGRMLGYGRVEVDAAGAQGAEVLDHLPNPSVFRDQVFVLSEKRRTGPPSAPAAPANPSGI